MASADESMELTANSVVGMTFAALLAFGFVLACILSTVKAVRDRREIKARNQAKRAAMASGNGHLSGSVDSDSQREKKPRPNILIIHDGDREQRIKRSSSRTNSAQSSPRFPSGVSSPGDHSSPYTETTLAEVAYRSSPGEDFEEDHEAESIGAAVSRKELNMRRDSSGEDLAGDAVAYRRSSGYDSSFTFESRSEERRSRRERRIQRKRDSTGRTGGFEYERSAVQGCLNSGSDFTRQRYTASEGDICDKEDQIAALQVPNSLSFHGFNKHRNAGVLSLHPTALERENVCTQYNPRRASYAAAMTNPAFDDLQARRHQSHGRHHTGSDDMTRMRPYSSRGAENLAYEEPDDSGTEL